MLAPPPPGRRAKRAPPALALAKPQTTDIQLEPELPPSPPKPKHKPRAKPAKNLNLKGLALALVPPPDAPAALLESPVSGGPVASEALVPQSPLPVHPPPPRRPSVVSLPASAAIPPTPAAAVVGFRKEEDGSPTAPYPDGPIEIMPRVWIGTDDHARDWQGLRDRGIRSIVNVAKELASPFEPPSTSLRSTYSTSDIPRVADPTEPRPVYYPANLQSGRPAFHYLKMPWSHGQANLVKQGFPVAMEFIDKALQRGDGVLIHCQCGVSRSATLTIAFVMRAAANADATAPAEILDLKGGGMHSAYAYVKAKSKWVGPNMSLIYQLLDYERVFQSGHTSPSSSVRSSQGNDEEEEWARQRMVMEAAESPIDNEAESSAFFNEAKALDLEMEERNVARKVSQSSFTSSSSTGHGMGAVWKSRYGFGSVRRARTGSTSSNRTTRSSTLSEELPEEEEGEGDSSGNTDANKLSPSTAATDDESHQWSQELTIPSDLSRLSVPQLGQFKPPPSAPVSKMSFSLPSRTGGKNKVKYRPSPLTALLPPVPPSPVPATAPIQEDLSSKLEAGPGNLPSLPVRRRTESRRPIPPPLHLRPTTRPRGQGSISSLSSNSSSVALSTPSQTLFVFPPSPTSNPSTMMLTATQPGFLPFPSLLTPRVSSMTKQGRTRSFIGLGAPPTPTTAFSIVEVRGTLNTPITATSSRSRK